MNQHSDANELIKPSVGSKSSFLFSDDGLKAVEIHFHVHIVVAWDSLFIIVAFLNYFDLSIV